MALLSFNKPLTLLACLSMLATGSVQAANLGQDKLKRVERDLKIMNNILKTSLSEQTDSRPSIDSVYLAEQGMLFTIEQRNGFHFEFHQIDLPELPSLPPVPVKAPVSVEMTEQQIEQIENAAMIAAESAMEMAEVSLDYISDFDWSSASSAERSAQKAQQTQLRSEKRELEHQARKLEREVRNVERKLRDSEFEEQLEKVELDSKKTAALKEQMDKLTASLSGVAEQLKANSTKLQQKAKEVKQQQEEKIKARLAMTEKVISETVCDFGAGLRSLEQNQHITFRIEGKVNRMYVFDQANVEQCADGKISAANLLQQATKYQL